MNSMSLHLILQKTYRNKIKKLTKSKNCYSITITARQSLKSEITMVEFFFFFNPFFFPPMQINRRDLQLENMRILTNLCLNVPSRKNITSAANLIQGTNLHQTPRTSQNYPFRKKSSSAKGNLLQTS